MTQIKMARHLFKISSTISNLCSPNTIFKKKILNPSLTSSTQIEIKR